MKNCTSFIYLVMVCIFASACEAHSPNALYGISYERYAESLRGAILQADVSKLRELVGNREVLDSHSIGLLIGADDNDGGLRKFFRENNKTIIFIDSIHHDKVDVAMIYFVRSTAVDDKAAPGTKFISKLEFGTDFIACEVSVVDSKIFMPNTLCFLETDAFERGVESD